MLSLTVSTPGVSVLLYYLVLCLVALLNSSVEMLTKVATVFALMFCFLWEAHSLAAPGLLALGAGDLNMQTVRGSSKVSEEAPTTWWLHGVRMLKPPLISRSKLRWRWSKIATWHRPLKPKLRTGSRISKCRHFRRRHLPFRLVLLYKRQPLVKKWLVRKSFFLPHILLCSSRSRTLALEEKTAKVQAPCLETSIDVPREFSVSSKEQHDALERNAHRQR